MSLLDEIDARLRAATPTPHKHHFTDNPLDCCPTCVVTARADGAMKIHAKSDLTLMSNLLRMVAASECIGQDDECAPDEEPCITCAVRRSLGIIPTTLSDQEVAIHGQMMVEKAEKALGVKFAKSPTCTNNSPREHTGHWREWHRGHGCDKDPGDGSNCWTLKSARASVSEAEIFKMDERRSRFWRQAWLPR